MSEASFTSEREPKGVMADLRTWTMQQQATGRCLFCPEWGVTGTVEEVERLSLEHRQELHPDNLRTRRRRRTPSLARWRTTLDEDSSAEVAEERRLRMRLLGIPEDT